VAAGGPRKNREGQGRINRSRASPHEVPVLSFSVGNTTERSAHGGADPVQVFLRRVEAGVGQGHAGGGDTELGESIEPANPALLDMIAGRKVGHLPGDPGLEHGRIESGDAANGRFPPPKSLPQSLNSGPDRSDSSNPGDHNSTFPHLRSCRTSRYRFIPARVRDAIPWTKTGPMTQLAAVPPISGQRGPPHSCTMVTSVPPAVGTIFQTTSIPVVIPRTCR